MNTRKLRKVLLTLCSALLLVSLSVGMTIAYLTDTTEVVTNTFTTGKVIIALDEADVKADGTYESDATVRVTENSYKLYPNRTYIKDPTIHVGTAKTGNTTSEDCWLFVKVTNEIENIEAATTIATQMADLGWAPVANEAGVFAYNRIVKNNENIVVFNNFKIKDDVDNDTLAAYEGKTITVQAYAVQADGFATAAAAWKDAPCTWGEKDTPAEEEPTPDTGA